MKNIIASLLLLCLLAAATGYTLNLPPAGTSGSDFHVNYGETVRTTAKRLEENQIIRSADYFVLLSYIWRRQSIKSGKYELHRGMTSLDILKKMTRGEILTGRVTIPEGFNLFQIAGRLDETGICDEADFLMYAHDEDFLASIRIYSPSAEGYLFPDTYVFPQESDPRDIIAQMHKRTLRELENLDALYSDSRIHDILTLASLIEEEARIPGERALISAVFHNRLRKNMRLDCDPTVRYAVKNFDGPLTYRDLDSDSPYNTYRRRGLPPTPISSPGRESLRAALRPAQSNYLFFVARNDGSHYFSTNLREHSRAVDYYQKGVKNGFRDRQKRAD